MFLRRGVLFLVLSGCVGNIATGSGIDSITPPPPPGGVSTAFTCDPASQGTTTPLRRLSQAQYSNTLRSLFSVIPSFDATQAAATALATVPFDQAPLTFVGTDSRVAEDHVTAWYNVADALATAITTDDAKLTALAGSCSTAASVTMVCVDAFLNGFGARALRRPLAADELARYEALNDGSRDGHELFRSLVFSLLMAPQFLYTVQVDGASITGDTVVALDPYELASRLSFHFWQTMPDDALFAAAADGSILTDDGYAAQLQRVANDARTQATIAGFYREWFELGSITQFPTTPAFTAFAMGTTIGQPGADHLAAADAEVQALVKHFTFETPGTMKDVLLSDLNFTPSPSLAEIYGVQPWDGTGPQPHLPKERSGLLTRMSMLLSGIMPSTHPIHRGAVVRRRILCEEIVQPSAASLPPGSLVPPPTDANETTRERFANKVMNEPCASCHKQMNPIGYVLEQYDAIGRMRSVENVYDDTTGALLNTLPIDSASAPLITPDDTASISTGPELSQKVADSGLAEACFARQYFRFAYHRAETVADNCALERVRSTLTAQTGSLKDALIQLANDPSFKSRRVE